MNPPELFITDRLLLRKPTLSDAEAIFNTYAQDPEVTRFLTWFPHKSILETQEFIIGCLASWKGGQRFPYVITLKENDSVIGMIEIRIDGFKADLGYGMGKNYWGNGYMVEALLALVGWALGQPGIYRVWAVCDTENTKSARVLEKGGMQREGVLRRFIIHPNISNEPRDCYLYAIVK
jgi:[ribosomal protein S5]-alanine N-acetyltransferase